VERRPTGVAFPAPAKRLCRRDNTAGASFREPAAASSRSSSTYPSAAGSIHRRHASASDEFKGKIRRVGILFWFGENQTFFDTDWTPWRQAHRIRRQRRIPRAGSTSARVRRRARRGWRPRIPCGPLGARRSAGRNDGDGRRVYYRSCRFLVTNYVFGMAAHSPSHRFL
jgi:hypothetical protein